MNKQELIKHFDELPYVSIHQMGKKSFIDLIEQLDEPQSQSCRSLWRILSQNRKKLSHTLSYSVDACMSDRVAEWYWDNSEFFAQAWVNGYEVEKEKRYLVKMKGMTDGCNCLNYRKIIEEWFLGGESEPVDYRTRHTRKELEASGFGWVFDCSGIEIEEVEDE